MSTRTTGAEFKRFYADDSFWPDDGTYHDGEWVQVDGVDIGEGADFTQIADDAKVELLGGVVMLKGEEGPSFESYFRKWRKAQKTAFLSVECDIDKVDEMKALITAAGGKCK